MNAFMVADEKINAELLCAFGDYIQVYFRERNIEETLKRLTHDFSAFGTGEEERTSGVSEFLCNRGFGYSGGIRTSNWIANRFRAAFQSRIGMVHAGLILRRAR
jgi:hypothetical protein